MTAQSNPYVRVYYSIIDDPKFEHVYDDDEALATWVRLLLTADAMYPAPSPLPYGIRRRALDKLVSAGLVDLLPGKRYRMHGLASEREMRAQSARDAAAKRWQSGRNAVASEPALHSEQSRAEPSRSYPSNSNGEHGQKTERRTTGLQHISDILPRKAS